MKTPVLSLVSVILASCGLSETNVTTRSVTRSYGRRSMLAETNVTHTIEGHEAMKRRWEKKFRDTDAILALRESRAGYKGGVWSNSWQEEASSWFEEQDIENLAPAFEFVDSKGFRHLMSFGLADSGRSEMKREMNLRRAEMSARIALSQAWDADVERCSEESNLTMDGHAENLKGESVMSVGQDAGIFNAFTKMVKVGGETKTAVVYGIIPSKMKFTNQKGSSGGNGMSTASWPIRVKEAARRIRPQ